MPIHQELPFRSHRLLPGGHLQTVATALMRPPRIQFPSVATPILLPDGDSIVIHDSQPDGWQVGDPSLLLIHGLCGSHQASYKLRLCQAFLARGVRCFRLDMRGCGAGIDLASQVNHAGRSADVLAAAEHVVAATESGPMGIIGVSLGGNQLLKMLGELGNGQLVSTRPVMERLHSAVAVAPPIDLMRCSRNMQRFSMRPYDRYFVRHLFDSIPTRVQCSPAFAALDLRKRPKTLWDLDNRVTAPLSGFGGAADYYDRCSSMHAVPHNPFSTLVLTAKNDPIVPVGCFENISWPSQTQCEVVPGGGHVAFLSRGRSRHWMDSRILQWFAASGFGGTISR